VGQQTFSLHKLSPELQSGLLSGNGRANQGSGGALAPDGLRQRTLIDCVAGLDELATVVTIGLSLERTGQRLPGEENDTPPVVGRVQFGVNGKLIEFELDYIDGALFCVPASSLRVTAAIDPLVLAPDASFNPCNVGAVVAYMPHGVARYAQRTIPIALPANAGEPPAPVPVTIPIPAFARDVTFLSNPAVMLLVEQLVDRAGTVVVAVDSINLTTPPRVVLPLANRTRYLRVSQDEDAPASVSAVFGLSV
jgi:hypothetical protein